MSRTLSVAIKENTYQELRQKVGVGKISSFVNQAVEKELHQLTQIEKKEKEQVRKQLIADYKSNARNKKLQKELRVFEEASLEDIFNKKVKKTDE